MKQVLSAAFKYLPLAIAVSIIVVGAFFVPWKEVLPYIISMSPLALGAVIALAFVYYFGRILRYSFILRTLGQPTGLHRITLAYFVAQPMTLLPGGEAYRSVMLKKYGNVAIRDGLPSVFAQSLTENMGLIIIALIGAIVLNRHIVIVVGVGLVVGAIMALLHFYNIRKSHKMINKLPTVDISHYRIKIFIDKNRELLRGGNLLILFVTSFISTFAGIGIVYVIASSFGADINVFQAAIAFTLPMILQYASFLPGGLGVNEHGSVGILLLLGGIALPAAVAITIVVRLMTLGFGIVMGYVAIGLLKVYTLRKQLVS